MTDINLVVVEGPGLGATFPVKAGRCKVLGRGDEADFKLLVPAISRRHCEVLRGDDDLLTVRDLGSRGGTFVNGVRVVEYRLAAGDKLRIGPVVFLVHSDKESTAESHGLDATVETERPAPSAHDTQLPAAFDLPAAAAAAMRAAAAASEPPPGMASDTQDLGHALLEIRDVTLFGKIAIRRGLITEAQLAEAVTRQHEGEALGAVFVREGWLAATDVEEVLRLQALQEIDAEDRRIGRLALRNGFLTPADLDRCLALRGERAAAGAPAPPLGEIMVAEGLLQPGDLDALLRHQQRLARPRSERRRPAGRAHESGRRPSARTATAAGTRGRRWALGAIVLVAAAGGLAALLMQGEDPPPVAAAPAGGAPAPDAAAGAARPAGLASTGRGTTLAPVGNPNDDAAFWGPARGAAAGVPAGADPTAPPSAVAPPSADAGSARRGGAPSVPTIAMGSPSGSGATPGRPPPADAPPPDAAAPEAAAPDPAPTDAAGADTPPLPATPGPATEAPAAVDRPLPFAAAGDAAADQKVPPASAAAGAWSFDDAVRRIVYDRFADDGRRLAARETWELEGARVARRERWRAVAPAESEEIRCVSDDLGRLIEERRFVGAEPLGAATRRYLDDGRLRSISHCNEYEIETDYERWYYPPDAQPPRIEVFDRGARLIAEIELDAAGLPRTRRAVSADGSRGGAARPGVQEWEFEPAAPPAQGRVPRALIEAWGYRVTPDGRVWRPRRQPGAGGASGAASEAGFGAGAAGHTAEAATYRAGLPATVQRGERTLTARAEFADDALAALTLVDEQGRTVERWRLER